MTEFETVVERLVGDRLREGGTAATEMGHPENPVNRTTPVAILSVAISILTI